MCDLGGVALWPSWRHVGFRYSCRDGLVRGCTPSGLVCPRFPANRDVELLVLFGGTVVDRHIIGVDLAEQSS